MCVCVRACVRACVCVCVCARALVCVCDGVGGFGVPWVYVCVWGGGGVNTRSSFPVNLWASHFLLLVGV